MLTDLRTAARVFPSLDMRSIPLSEWDRTVADFEGICQEQLHVFAHARWPTADLEAVLFFDGSEVVGGSLVIVKPLPLKLATIAVVKWGPMLRFTKEERSRQYYKAMVDLLVEHYALQRNMMLSIGAHAATPDEENDFDYLLEAGFQPGLQLPYPDRYIIDLKTPESERRARLGQSWRRQLAKSERENLVFEHGAPDQRSVFDALYHSMLDRKQYGDNSGYNSLDAMLDLDVPNLRPELFFVRKDGEAVAGAVIFKSGDRAVYLYGATNDRALDLRAGYFMHWHVIQWLQENTRAKWYDLGGAAGTQGLHVFKKGMIGQDGLISPFPPFADYAARKSTFMIGRSAFALREKIRQLRAR